MAKDTELEDFKELLSNPDKEKENAPVRTTFLLEAELSQRLDKLAEGKKRGIKTKFLNQAVKRLLDELES